MLDNKCKKLARQYKILSLQNKFQFFLQTLLPSLKGQSHEMDLAHFKFLGRSWPDYEPRMVFIILYLFISVNYNKCFSSGSTKHLPVCYLLNVPLAKSAEKV